MDADRRHCWHPYTQHGLAEPLLPVVSASGSRLTLADGRELIDAISSWWTVLHGHGHPRLVSALERQARTLDHVLFAGCAHEPAARLAQRLVELAAPMAGGAPGLSRVFYSDDGSTAVEVALKASYQSWLRRGQEGRTLFIALEEAYHGDTFGAMAVGEPGVFFCEFAPFLFEVRRIPPKEEALSRVLAEEGSRTAGVIVEPLVQGAAGMLMYPESFLRAARRLCDEAGVHLIADEVMTGFGRTGAPFACWRAGVCPDLMAVAKGLTGGVFPLSATLVKEEIYASFLSDDRGRSFFHGHSFTANPMGCALALASLDIFEEEDTPARLSAIGERISAGLEALRAHPGVADLRRLGGIVAVSLGAEDGGYLSGLGDRLRSEIARRDVLLRPLGNVLYAIPPSSTTMEECDRIAAVMAEVIVAALG